MIDWFQRYPQLEIISRDGSCQFTDAADQGAPQAQQLDFPNTKRGQASQQSREQRLEKYRHALTLSAKGMNQSAIMFPYRCNKDQRRRD